MGSGRHGHLGAAPSNWRAQQATVIRHSVFPINQSRVPSPRKRQFCPSGVFGNVWKHVWKCHNLGSATCTRLRTGPTAKNDLAPEVTSAETEKAWVREHYLGWKVAKRKYARATLGPT